MSSSLGLYVVFGAPLIAVVTKTRSSHTTGLEWPSPGIGVLQRMLADFSASHEVGRGWPSATPEAFGPRNDGQFSARATVVRKIDKPSAKILCMQLVFFIPSLC